ncbi:MAG: WXG100 family type VII secretion target [Longispora sp.]|nr:WXG100 family type VII secretion target [Longispora sp. (in: high G+C Gram-positive bacteria)]
MAIKVDYASLEHASSQIRSISSQINEKLDGLRADLQKMTWDGQDRESYTAHQGKWDEAVGDLNAILASIGQAVSVARENYMATELSNSRLWQ